MTPRFLFCCKYNAKCIEILYFSGLVFGYPSLIIFPTWCPKTWFWDSYTGSSWARNPPTLAGVRRCQIRETESARICKYRWPRWIRNGIPNCVFGPIKPAKTWFVCDIGPPFCRTKKNNLAQIYINLKTSARNHPRHWFCLISNVFWSSIFHWSNATS